MHQMNIQHEDVLMKLFMYSLEGDAREWYRSLPPSSISSLKEFHATFSNHCKRLFSADLLFENCCEEFEVYVQHAVGFFPSDCKDVRDVYVEEIEERII
jgi:hypothetical protein